MRQMARYKHMDIGNGQGMFLTVNLEDQLLPGTFEKMLSDLIGTKIDISEFDNNYNNDETGAKAISPAVLIKLIIYGYSRGHKSSRKISELCRNNIIAKALSEGTEPHWTTIADFISSNSEIFQEIFVEVLAYCNELGLIGGETFAIDGCRIPSNASKELSGTKAELEKKVKAYRKMAEKHIAKHKRQDELGEVNKEVEHKFIERQKKLNIQISKISDFLTNMKIKEGRCLKELKSNVTDNESALMKSSSGYIQGYIGLAVSDDRDQIIVSAEAVGSATENEYFPQMLDETLSNIDEVEVQAPQGKKRTMMGDAHYFTEDNLRACEDRGIEAIIPDSQAKRRLGKDKEELYDVSDFKYNQEGNYYECPNGKKLEYKRSLVLPGNRDGKQYRANVKDCSVCPLKARCIKSRKKTNKSNNGKMLLITKSNEAGSLCRAMREKLKTEEYQDKYGYRMQIIEPVFANITYCKGLNRFSLRGKRKVNGQWLLYCIVHNLGKCLKGYNMVMGYT